MQATEFLSYALEGHKHDSKTDSFMKEIDNLFTLGLSEQSLNRRMINEATVRVDVGSEQWDKVSTKTLLFQLYRKAGELRGYNPQAQYGSFLGLIKKLTKMGIYGSFLTDKYTEDEINEVASYLTPGRDELFTYVGLMMLSDRYLARDYINQVYELPQERFMVIALTVMQDESPENRMEHVKEAYWALSELYMTVATPTMSNSGKVDGQLSSCFIDSVDDSLDGIYLDNWDNARVSKHGGGVGVYMGKVRGRNSSIRGYKNKASGVIPWIRNLNNTAVSVDQLGMRSGAMAVYLDIWHVDVLLFLQIGTNNGDERMKARDVFPGLCVPDYFMELIEADEDGRMLTPDAIWHLFDPHEVRQEMGWSLEDSYDEEEGSGTWRTRYQECIDNPNLRRIEVPVREIVKAMVVADIETGSPYMFYRDEVNRQNANKHKGMIYCSNLCTEIAQNMSPSSLVGEWVTEEDGTEYIIYKRKIGDFVVCNLSSINLGRAYRDGVIRRVIRIMMRMLDNVIDVNNLPLHQATRTNKKYRPVGLGTFGWHHLLAILGIKWDDMASVELADTLYEDIAFYAIEMSHELAMEKGSYEYFEGSEYHTGVYFDRKGYTDARHNWSTLKAKVKKGIRNGYWGAVAPNASTALIAGSTQGIDPFYGAQGIYYEEKKDFKVPVLAPDLSPETWEFYYRQNAHYVSQEISILQNARRQRHIDQAVSFNLYVPSGIKAKDLMQLHRKAWRNKLKTTYYVRGTANLVDDCEACQ